MPPPDLAGVADSRPAARPRTAAPSPAAVARVAVRAAVHQHQRLVDQPRQQIEHRELVARRRRRPRRGLERPAAGEHRQPPQQPLLAPERAGRSSTRSPPAASAGAAARSGCRRSAAGSGRPAGRESARPTAACTRAAASSIASGMPSSRRQISATARGVVVGQREVGRDRGARDRRTAARRATRATARGVTRAGRRARRASAPRTAARRRRRAPSRLVASTRRPRHGPQQGVGRARRTAASRCSQLSSTSSSRRPLHVLDERGPQVLVRRSRARRDAGDGLERRSSASLTGARSTNQTPVGIARSRVFGHRESPVASCRRRRSRSASAGGCRRAAARTRRSPARGRRTGCAAAAGCCAVPAGAAAPPACRHRSSPRRSLRRTARCWRTGPAGRFARPRATIRARAGGTAGRDSVTGRASAVTCIRSSASAVAATNGGCPASISNSTQAERVDVGPLIDRPAGRLLGAHVLRSADDRANHGGHLRALIRRLRTHRAGDAEVGHQRHAVRRAGCSRA